MEKERFRAIGYRRVSMREQVDGHGLAAQAKNIRAYAAGQGWDLLEIYTDAGISAKKDSFRLELARLMQSAGQGMFDVVLCNNYMEGKLPAGVDWVQPSEQLQDEYPAYMGDFVNQEKPHCHDSAKLAQTFMDLYNERTGSTREGG